MYKQKSEHSKAMGDRGNQFTKLFNYSKLRGLRINHKRLHRLLFRINFTLTLGYPSPALLRLPPSSPNARDGEQGSRRIFFLTKKNGAKRTFRAPKRLVAQRRRYVRVYKDINAASATFWEKGAAVCQAQACFLHRKRGKPKGLPRRGSSSWTRTNDPAVNSRMLYQLSYRGIFNLTRLLYYLYIYLSSTFLNIYNKF